MPEPRPRAQSDGAARDVPPSSGATSGSKPRFHVLSFDEVLSTPDPEPLVDGIIQRHELAVFFGPPGAAKTTVALDLSLSIATGVSFFERGVRAGKVVYIAVEGRLGIKLRIKAWLGERLQQLTPVLQERFFLIAQPVRVFCEGDVEELIEQLAPMAGSNELVVIDPLAYCMEDGDESKTADMQIFVAVAKRIQTRLQTAVLVLHHTGWDENHERGSNALRAAADTVFRVSKDGRTVSLTNVKQRDTALVPTLVFQLVDVVVGRDVQGMPLTSVRLERPQQHDESESSRSTAVRNAEKVRDVLRDKFAAAGAKSEQLMKAVGLKRMAFYAAAKLARKRSWILSVRSGRSWIYTFASGSASDSSHSSPSVSSQESTGPRFVSPSSPPFRGETGRNGTNSNRRENPDDSSRAGASAGGGK